jgi:ComF family protein
MIVVGIIRAAISFALPSRCPGCGNIVTDHPSFCLPCWTTIDFLSDGGCNACGLPIIGVDLTCGACLKHPPLHDGVRAAIAYGVVARQTVLKFKYSGKVGLAEVLAQGIGRFIQNAPDALLVPVPLHRWRLWKRGFNQSALVARRLANTYGNDLCVNALVRHRQTPSLGTLGPRQRAKAVSGAFSASDAGARAVNGRQVILIDDIYTTGATANACTKILKQAGAKSVQVVCWARVIPDQ